MRILKPLLAAFFVLACGPAMAQQVCAQLQSQLAALDQGGGAAAAAAARAQQARATYDANYRAAQQMGCITMFRIFAPPQCGAVLQNLDALRAAMNAQPQAPAASPAARAAILAALQQNGCNGATNAAATRPRGDTWRTICVRPEDGYFFPISFATTTNRFETDAASCAAQCVGATLFAYRNPGGTVDEAVDARGQRYVDMPNAYRYRTAFDPSVRCSLSPTVVATVAPSPPPAAQPQVVVPVPLPRPVPSEDPETRANRAGRLDVVPRPAEQAILTAGGVRLIGPAFYYAQ